MVVGIAARTAPSPAARGSLRFTSCWTVGAIGDPQVIGPWPFPGRTFEMPEGLGSGLLFLSSSPHPPPDEEKMRLSQWVEVEFMG